jgi:hypothetical protein
MEVTSDALVLKKVIPSPERLFDDVTGYVNMFHEVLAPMTGSIIPDSVSSLQNFWKGKIVYYYCRTNNLFL